MTTTIHGTGYRQLEYEPTPRWARIWPIAVLEFKSLFRRRFGNWLYFVCFGPSLFMLGVMIVYLNQAQIMGNEDAGQMIDRMLGTGGGAFYPRAASFYIEPTLSWNFIVFLFLTFLVSCRAIAKDRAANALEIYWTRGITPLDYFVGKWLGSILLLGLPMAVCPTVIWLVGVLSAEDWTFFQDTAGFVLPAIAGLIGFTAVMTGIPTAFSALCRNPNFAAILWLMLVTGTTLLANLLAHEVMRGDQWISAISPWEGGAHIVRSMTGAPTNFSYDAWGAAFILGGICFVLVLLVLRKLRLREAVA